MPIEEMKALSLEEKENLEEKIAKMKAYYLEEKEEWKKWTALAETRTKNIMKRETHKLKMDLYSLGYGVFNLKPGDISETEIKNFKYYIHDIFDELERIGLLDDDEIRM